MLERDIELKRNRFFLFSFSFLTIILLGVIVFIWAFKGFGVVGFRIAEILTLIFAVGISLKHSCKFDKVITFNEKYIVISRKIFKKVVEEKRILADNIEKIIFEEKKNRISLYLYDEGLYSLVDFSYLKDIGIEKFFLIKAELFRYYPEKAKSLKDDFVEKYINENMIPEYIRDLNFSGRCKVIIILIAEVVFAALPLVSCLISFAWGFAYVASISLSVLISLLNKLLMLF